MSSRFVEDARPWFQQAASDARTAEALLAAPAPLQLGDVGCHVAAMCAQAVEKSLKAYLFLNGATPALDHRPDGYLVALLRGDPLLRYGGHRAELSKLFVPTTRSIVRKLLDLTPGGLGSRIDVPNTEYPWIDAAKGRLPPYAAAEFSGAPEIAEWLATAKRVTDGLRKLWIAVDRATAL